MRCRACDSPLNNSPLFTKLDDGTVIVNDLCNKCNFISANPDSLSTKNYTFEGRADFLENLIAANKD